MANFSEGRPIFVRVYALYSLAVIYETTDFYTKRRVEHTRVVIIQNNTVYVQIYSTVCYADDALNAIVLIPLLNKRQ